ncbi:MAG TPA: protein phosphatase 2C domain-containing protein [Gemmataceae bacterium]|nr:protein phosphatase 2C domain-containing protein [Gemmataceae bacterium]
MNRFDQIEYASLTDVGVRRSHNQDNLAVQLASDDAQWRQRGHLFLVADGMGAHAVGEKASEQAAGVIPHTFFKHIQQNPPGSALRKAFIEANAHIHACGQANREFEGMGTTTTALLVRPEGAWVSHVGDSRVYRIRDGWIEQLSYDHSLLWEYARIKNVDPDEVQDIPSNVIHRCLGPEPFVQIDVEGPHSVEPGDIFLLCSDGLSGQVNDSEMGAVATALPPAEACRFLVDLANLRGGPDNITVVIVRIPAGPEANGVTSTLRRRTLPQPPWWLLALAGGTLLAFGAAAMQFSGWPGGVYVFLAASVVIVAGLIGLGLRYRKEQAQRQEEDEPSSPPRVHRRAACRIEAPLIDRISRAVAVLKQRAEDNNWEPDWSAFQDHHGQAEELLQGKDLVGAFREYCRTMLPLSKALNKHRKKEEVFQPIWDKSPEALRRKIDPGFFTR